MAKSEKTFIDRLIPPKYDFYQMLIKQAEITAEGILTLTQWLEAPTTDSYQRLMELASEADTVRLEMERCLIQSFATPFDRQDMYEFSVRMDRILDFAKATALAVEAYNVTPDPLFVGMAGHLSVGVATLSKAVALLEGSPKEAENWIEKMRLANIEVVNCYRMALVKVFGGPDVMEALKCREVYNDLKDAAEYMEMTIDVFHKIIVRLG